MRRKDATSTKRKNLFIISNNNPETKNIQEIIESSKANFDISNQPYEKIKAREIEVPLKEKKNNKIEMNKDLDEIFNLSKNQRKLK